MVYHLRLQSFRSRVGLAVCAGCYPLVCPGAMEGLEDLMAYVDNFFLFSKSKKEAIQRERRVGALLSRLGVPLHECQSLTQELEGLGWLWDTKRMLMICSEAKHTVVCALLLKWADPRTLALSFKEVERACGLMLWISSGFQMGRGDVAWVMALRTAGERIAARLRVPKHAVRIPLSDGAREAFAFWAAFFPTWNRECPIVQGWGPSAAWEWFGQVDASTEWGCGGVLFPRDPSAPIRAFAHEWSKEERASSIVTSRESTGVLEMLGVVWWLRLFASFCPRSRLLLEVPLSRAVMMQTYLLSMSTARPCL
jgi:hypothetical protein